MIEPGSRKPKGLSKDALYAGFTAGKTDQEMAVEFGVVDKTINYHRQRWKKAGQPVTANSPADNAESLTTTPAQAPVVAPAPPAEPPANPPASAEELSRLAAALNNRNVTAAPANPPATPPAPTQPPAIVVVTKQEPVPPCKTGEILEGSIYRVGDNFILVDLVELADPKGFSPRGKVNMDETGVPVGQWWKHFREGDLVNVKVLAAIPDAIRRGGWRIDLSIKQAPAHSKGRKVEEEQPQQQTAAQPLMVPTSVSITGTGAGNPLPPILPASSETVTWTPPAPPKPQSLCEVCLKADVCPFAEFYQTEVEPTAEEKPGRLASIKVVFGPRPVTECSAVARKVG